LKFSWIALCARCSNDKELDKAFEQTCCIEENSLAVDVPRTQVESGIETGYTVIGNLAFVNQKDLATVLDTTMSANAAKIKIDKMPDCFGTLTKGALIQHPSKPFLEVQVWTRVSLSKSDVALPAKSCLCEDHGLSVHKREKKLFMTRLPKALRSWTKAPSIQDLKDRVAVVARAAGEVEAEEDEEDEGEEEEGEDPAGDESGASETDTAVATVVEGHKVLILYFMRHTFDEVPVDHFVVWALLEHMLPCSEVLWLLFGFVFLQIV
jgi:hypothetical protein